MSTLTDRLTPELRAKLKKYGGYTAFFGAAFAMMLYWTFPYEAIVDRVVLEARKSNLEVKIGSLGAGLLGPKAKNVAIRKTAPAGAPEPDPMILDELSLRPLLTMNGFAYEARAFGGTIAGSIKPMGAVVPVSMKLKGVEVSRANLKGLTGLDVGGTLGGVVDLKLDSKDNSKSTGRIALMGDNLIIHGGTVSHYDLPKVELGRLEAEIKLADGKASVESFKATGSDVEATTEGDVNLAQKMLFSNLKLKLKFKPSEDFLKRNSFIQTGLSFAMSKDPKGFYAVNVGGMLGSPRFTPIR